MTDITLVKEWINAPAEDDWTCLCGNGPGWQGFYPCLPNGEYVEPIIGSEWDEKLLKCDNCGRIMDQSTWNGVAVAVVGQRA